MSKDGLTEHLETPAEELANAATHGLGAALSVAGLVTLLSLAARSGDPVRVATLAIFGASLVAVYVASTLYHALPAGRWKYRALILDHAAIYLVIAGTYTPVLLVTLENGRGAALLGVVWACAAAGIALKAFYVERFRLLTTVMYLVMGWMIVVAINPLLAAMPAGGWTWLIAGGVAYTGGVAFFLWESLPFNHAIWHLFVIAGSACHFLMMLWYVLPRAGG